MNEAQRNECPSETKCSGVDRFVMRIDDTMPSVFDRGVQVFTAGKLQLIPVCELREHLLDAIGVEAHDISVLGDNLTMVIYADFHSANHLRRHFYNYDCVMGKKAGDSRNYFMITKGR